MNGFLNRLKSGGSSPRDVPDSRRSESASPSCNGCNVRGDLGESSMCDARPGPVVPSLVHSLSQVLRESSALTYFIQFMDTHGQLDLVKFWLHVESFKTTTSRIDPHDHDAIAIATAEAGRIYSKYLGVDAANCVGLPDAVRNCVIDKMCPDDRAVHAECFDDAQNFVYEVMEKRFFKEFLASVFYLKHRLQFLVDGSLALHDILVDDVLLTLFIEFLEIEGARALLEFVLAADVLANEEKGRKDEEQVEDAMLIYDKYFSMQATEPLDFGRAIRVEIEMKICTKSGRVDPTVFDSARSLAHNLLETNWPGYLNYVRELNAIVENHVELPGHRSRKTTFSSDRSSDVSVQLDKRGMSEDEETASQPDSLASSSTTALTTPRSRLKSRMALASVDEYGRYRRSYDDRFSDANSPTSRRLKSRLDRYLNQSAVKEEQMADQIAQLIVADVQNMVCSAQSPECS